MDFDADMFDELYNDDSQEREFTHKIYGYDNNPKANEIATHNIKAAGVSKDVVLKRNRSSNSNSRKRSLSSSPTLLMESVFPPMICSDYTK